MTSFPLGILLMVGLIVMSLVDVQAAVFLNYHSIALVCGGTVAILMTSTPWKEIGSLFRHLWGIWKSTIPVGEINQSLITLSKGARTLSNPAHPVLARAVSLWEQGVDPELFEQLLHQSLDECNQSIEQAVTTLRNLSKYPPALGMTGTVMGLVTMFSQLGSQQQANMGPSLALAMTATFYGLILANGFILPLADRLGIQQMAQIHFNDYVFRAVILIQRGEATSIVEDKIHAYAA